MAAIPNGLFGVIARKNAGGGGGTLIATTTGFRADIGGVEQDTNSRTVVDYSGYNITGFQVRDTTKDGTLSGGGLGLFINYASETDRANSEALMPLTSTQVIRCEDSSGNWWEISGTVSKWTTATGRISGTWSGTLLVDESSSFYLE